MAQVSIFIQSIHILCSGDSETMEQVLQQAIAPIAGLLVPAKETPPPVVDLRQKKRPRRIHVAEGERKPVKGVEC